MPNETNRNHPEKRPGEIWYCNIGSNKDPDDDLSDVIRDFERINLRTKRIGHTAYDILDKEIPTMRPVFVKLFELEAKGIKPKDLPRFP